jgi:hypothetical protein
VSQLGWYLFLIFVAIPTRIILKYLYKTSHHQNNKLIGLKVKDLENTGRIIKSKAGYLPIGFWLEEAVE